mgnify:CR=1 FL=1
MNKNLKWAIYAVADQTIVYLDDNGETWTTKHSEAKLFNHLYEASKALLLLYDQDQFEVGSGCIEDIEDINEFKLREDTW